jgi:class 3 adenylate cyclase
MKKEIYQDHADNIRNLMANGQRRGSFTKSFSAHDIHGSSDLTRIKAINEAKDKSLFNSLTPINSTLAGRPKYHEKPGAHPDFDSIRQSGVPEEHSITSMFLDIKNSTRLFGIYEPLAVAQITTAIQRVAVHTCWYFGGFIQRYHGDGLLVYFGGRNTTIEQSVQQAVNAASFFSYFMEYDLENIFRALDIEVENRLYTRIGIDVGSHKEVVWHLAGMGDCSEVTTCSLHTSLAAKMQVNAENNGIMVGDNVKTKAGIDERLFSIIKDKEGKEDRYIFRIPAENFNYTQWKFNWSQFVKNHPDVIEGDDGKLYFRPIETAMEAPSLNTAYLKKETENYKPYFHG